MPFRNTVDSRSINTLIYFLSQNINIDDITYSSKFEFNSSVNKKTYIKFNSQAFPKYKIDVSLVKGVIVFKIINGLNLSNFDCMPFYAFPSLKQTRYILNTSKNIYKHSIDFYKPYKYILRVKRVFLKVMIFFGYNRVNIKVFFVIDDKIIRETLSRNFYTGVEDGKQTVVSMLINNNTISGYMKLRPNESEFFNSENEYLFAKKFANMVDNKKIIIPNIKKINHNYKPLIINSSYYQRSFNLKKDLNLIFNFLSSIQQKVNHKTIFDIFNFESLGKEFDPIFNQLKDYYFDVSYCHGDLSPWNFYISDNKLFIFDFETSENNVPITYDFAILSKSYYQIRNKLYLIFLEKLIRNYFSYRNLYISNQELQKYMLVSLFYYLFKIKQRNSNNIFCSDQKDIKEAIFKLYSNFNNEKTYD